MMKASILLALVAVCAAASWDYTDPNKLWSGDCSSGKKQSPINIVKANVEKDTNLYKLQAPNYNETRTGSTYTISNNGHGLVVTPVIDTTDLFDALPYMVSQHVAYELAQFHFHWGINDTQGSEHTVDGKEYPLEVHFVHYNRKYGNISAAVEKSDGLLVLGYLFEISSAENEDLKPIIDAVKDVLYLGNSTSIPFFPPQKLFPTEWYKFFHYEGSLTTPGCYESVKWFVDQAPLKVSSAQVAELRKMYEGSNQDKPMTHNFRPPQGLNGRKVKSIEVDKTYIYISPSKWDYESTEIGASAWPKLFPICVDNTETSRQSPINIVSANATHDDDLKPLKMTSYDSANQNMMQLSNNGHSITVSLGGSRFDSSVEHLGVEYELAQFHFHWSDQPLGGGSEHTHDGKQYFAEVHFVHFNKKYDSLGAAAAKSDGLLVWGHFIQAGNGSSNHTGYKTIFDAFENVKYKESTHNIDYVKPADLIPPMHNHYYTYPGSLTTPRCFESVTWIVNRDIIDISVDQAHQMLGVLENKNGDAEKKMYNNWRPVQDLNNRVVRKNFGADSTDPTDSASTTIQISFVSMLFALVCYLAL
ncbi:uncharacterized protein [Clytia hemisphaerica]